MVCEPHFQLLEKYGTAVFCEGRVRLLNPLDWIDLGAAALRHVPVFSKLEFQPVLLGAFGQIDFINAQHGIFLSYHLFVMSSAPRFKNLGYPFFAPMSWCHPSWATPILESVLRSSKRHL